jgi:DNA-binding HxlR family transcriptional regulator
MVKIVLVRFKMDVSTQRMMREPGGDQMKRMRKTYGCPVELSLDLLGGKWKSIILARLKDRPVGYGELRRLITDLSDKVLTERLKGLEAQGLVKRVPADRRPARFRYTLTDRGESLRPVLEALYNWGEQAAADLNLQIRPTPARE